MRLIQLFQQLRVWLHYRRAAFVNTRDELEAAMRRSPPRIVVDGDEALRAFAAALITGEGDVVESPQAQSTAALIVPPLGRVRHGHTISRRHKGEARPSLKGGMDIVLVTALGLCAALTAEWLSFPAEPHLILRPRMTEAARRALQSALRDSTPSDWAMQLAIPLLGTIAVAAFAWVVWQVLQLGKPLQIGWQLEYRVHGRLVMSRVRRRPM